MLSIGSEAYFSDTFLHHVKRSERKYFYASALHTGCSENVVTLFQCYFSLVSLLLFRRLFRVQRGFRVRVWEQQFGGESEREQSAQEAVFGTRAGTELETGRGRLVGRLSGLDRRRTAGRRLPLDQRTAKVPRVATDRSEIAFLNGVVGFE